MDTPSSPISMEIGQTVVQDCFFALNVAIVIGQHMCTVGRHEGRHFCTKP